MKATLLSRLVAVLGVLALSVTVAQAGGSHGGGGTEAFGYLCYAINGADQGVTVNILDQTGEFGQLNNVRVGGGRLVCTFASATKTDTLHPDFDPVDGDGAHLICFNISGPGLQNPKVVAQLSHPFDNLETVTVNVSRYFCPFGSKTIPSGP